MAPRRSILFAIRLFVTVFKTAQYLSDLSIPDATAMILGYQVLYFLPCTFSFGECRVCLDILIKTLYTFLFCTTSL